MHQLLEQPSVTVAVSSACQSSIVNVFDTMRVPGFRSRIFGRSFRLIDGSRNIVITFAFDRSVSNRSAFTNVARSVTPASFALRFDSSTMSGLYSMPIARAPRLAAVITVRPSPDPRSITKSVFVTFAMSSILSTTACGVGHPHHVLAGLADLRLEGLLSGGRGLSVRRAREHHGHDQGCNHSSCAHRIVSILSANQNISGESGLGQTVYVCGFTPDSAAVFTAPACVRSLIR